jgi:hypothetical protein
VPLRPYPHPSLSLARDLQVYLNAPCTSCSPSLFIVPCITVRPGLPYHRRPALPPIPLTFLHSRCRRQPPHAPCCHTPSASPALGLRVPCYSCFFLPRVQPCIAASPLFSCSAAARVPSTLRPFPCRRPVPPSACAPVRRHQEFRFPPTRLGPTSRPCSAAPRLPPVRRPLLRQNSTTTMHPRSK